MTGLSVTSCFSVSPFPQLSPIVFFYETSLGKKIKTEEVSFSMMRKILLILLAK